MGGIHRGTIVRLMVRVGDGCLRLMDEKMPRALRMTPAMASVTDRYGLSKNWLILLDNWTECVVMLVRTRAIY